MSNRAITWAASMHPGPGPKAVLFCLADHASDHSGEDWTCFPSIDRIMDFTDMSRATVERHLKALWREGYISRVRRRRADGRLGIYDFTLHQAAERRAELKAARAGAQEAETEGETAAAPDVNLTCGPDVNLSAATRQNGAEPHVKLRGQEPLGDPSGNPHAGRVREPGDQGFEALAELWPDSGRKRTNFGQARAAWAFACGLETADRLLAAGRAAAADPELHRGDFGFPGLHTWLSEERWRGFLPRPPVAAAAPEFVAFAGPTEIALALQARADVAACLAGAVWRPADRTVLTRTGWAADELVRRIGRQQLAELEINVERAAVAQGS